MAPNPFAPNKGRATPTPGDRLIEACRFQIAADRVRNAVDLLEPTAPAMAAFLRGQAGGLERRALDCLKKGVIALNDGKHSLTARYRDALFAYEQAHRAVLAFGEMATSAQQLLRLRQAFVDVADATAKIVALDREYTESLS